MWLCFYKVMKHLPREKCLQRGIKALSNAELLCLVLGSGVKNNNFVRLALLVEKTFADNLPQAAYPDLIKLKGIGTVSALRIMAGFELSRRFLKQKNSDTRLINADRIVLCVSELRFLKQEHCVGLYVDARHMLIHKEILSKGTLTESLLHPREVFYEAIKNQAAGVVIVHNHPSGDPTPSEEDIFVTRQLFQAAELIGISLIDHVIIATDKHISMRELGLL